MIPSINCKILPHQSLWQLNKCSRQWSRLRRSVRVSMWASKLESWQNLSFRRSYICAPRRIACPMESLTTKTPSHTTPLRRSHRVNLKISMSSSWIWLICSDYGYSVPHYLLIWNNGPTQRSHSHSSHAALWGRTISEVRNIFSFSDNVDLAIGSTRYIRCSAEEKRSGSRFVLVHITQW